MRQFLVILFTLGVLILAATGVGWQIFPGWSKTEGGVLALGTAMTGGALLTVVSLMMLLKRAGADRFGIPITTAGVGLSVPELEAAKPVNRRPSGLAALGKAYTDWRKKPPVMAEPPLEDIVRRPVEYEQIVRALVDAARRASADRETNVVGITSRLRGAGGYGKTCLAQEVCTDKRVWTAFPDGILWVTLGDHHTQAGFIARVGELVAFLTGEQPPFEDAKSAQASLGNMLKHRQALLVIDDARQQADMDLYLQPGSRSTCLVITRFDVVLPPGARRIHIDAMGKDEAAALLGAGLPEESRNGLREDLEALAGRLGNWPLLLSLARGYLADHIDLGSTAQQALSTANQAFDRLGLAGFDARDPLERSCAADVVLTACTEQLEPAQYERFAQLAVFAENEVVPPAALGVLWDFSAGMEPAVVETLCAQLYHRSLLQQYDVQARKVRVHEVVRDWLVRQQRDGMVSLHQAILAGYRRRCEKGQWSQGPRDGYFFRWLAYHLAEAGHDHELAELLLNFDWLDAHLRSGGIHELLEDYETGLAVAQQAREEIRLVQGALFLGRHVLAGDPDQLAAQLFGRLAGCPQASIQRLLDGARGWPAPIWLRPLRACFPAPSEEKVSILAGHFGTVREYANSPDGGRAVSVSGDWTLRVEDLAVEQALPLRPGHSGAVTTAAISPNSRRAVTSGDDRTLLVWDLESGELLHTLKGSPDQTLVAAFSANSRRVVASSEDRAIRTWSTESGRLQDTLRGHPAWVKAVTITLDSQRVVSCMPDGILKVWELETGRLLQTLEGHARPVTAAAITPDGRRLISASNDRTLKVWDLEARRLVCTLAGQPGIIPAVAITPDGSRAVSASLDGTLNAWDLESGELLHALAGHSAPVRAAAVTPDGRWAVSGSDDATLKVWDLERGEVCTSLGLNGPVQTCAVSPDGRFIAAGGMPGDVYILRFEGEVFR